MSQIQVLDPHLADLIAAGEVVERPASVAKELMENAIDAGATKITVEIEHGGMTYLRVTDNGGGIPSDQLSTAFLRHATSKLRTQRDLEAIGTLGFRGEALAAIAAVSRIEMMSRQADADLGASLTLEGGTPGVVEEAGCPLGTTLVVRDLFYNTPARLKFVKKDAAEGAAVFAAVQRTALSHPEVAVIFLRDGKQEMATPGDGTLKSALYAVLGRNLALGFVAVCGSGDNMSVEGFTSLPTCCRGSRSYQHFFVNGRYVKSRTMMAALEEAYRNQKMVGKFPGCALHLTLRPSAVDVNVHPAKTEVKFHAEREVFSAVYHAVQAALAGDCSRPVVQASMATPVNLKPSVSVESDVGSAYHALRPATEPMAESGGTHTMRSLQEQPQTPVQTELPLHDFHHKSENHPEATPRVQRIWSAPESKIPVAPRPTPSVTAPSVTATPCHSSSSCHSERSEESDPGASAKILHCVQDDTAVATETSIPVAPSPRELSAKPTEGATQAPSQRELSAGPTEGASLPPWKVQGEILNTYIIVEQGDTVLLIDKHAAHERMNFDRMKAEGYTPMMQTLLVPLSLRLPGEELSVLLEHLPLLEEFGFQAEDFGGSLLVRQIPFDVDVEGVEEVLASLAQTLCTTGRADPAAARDHLLHSMACKAAIKGGWHSSDLERQRVAEMVMSGTVKYCPHGRPVAVEMGKYQIEKMFKRA